MAVLRLITVKVLVKYSLNMHDHSQVAHMHYFMIPSEVC